MIGHSPTASVAGRGDSDEPQRDVVLGLLANQRRRDALACLSEHARPVSLADLAEDVAACELDCERTEIPKEAIQEVRTSLYHNHVPKLSDAGVVEYDADRDVVRLSEDTDFVDHVLAMATDDLWG